MASQPVQALLKQSRTFTINYTHNLTQLCRWNQNERSGFKKNHQLHYFPLINDTKIITENNPVKIQQAIIYSFLISSFY